MSMPRYAQDALYGSGSSGGGGGFSPSSLYGASALTGGLTGLFANLFGGDAGQPYKSGMKELSKYTNQAAGYQNPFYNAGTSAIPQYQDYLSKMQDPAKFINDLTSQYSTSPYEQYSQDQAMRASTNQGSANGTTGSSALQLQAQENASNISNQFMDQWLQHVLGINTQYGSGLQNEIGSGQQSANQLSRMYEMLGQEMAKGQYGKNAARQQQQSSMFGDIGSALGGAALLWGL